MSDSLPSDHTSPLGRDMDCPSCGHSVHSPFVCGIDVSTETGSARCPCHRVPTPGLISIAAHFA